MPIQCSKLNGPTVTASSWVQKNSLMLWVFCVSTYILASCYVHLAFCKKVWPIWFSVGCVGVAVLMVRGMEGQASPLQLSTIVAVAWALLT